MRIAGTKLIVGLFFAVAGLLMTADNLDLLDAERYLRFWPVVLLVVGLIKLADPGRRLLGVVLTIVGASLLARFAGWVPITIFDLWPLLLILAGAGMVARAFGTRSVPAEGGERRNVWAVLSTQKVVNRSQDFTGARMAAFMGGCELDLTQADIANGPAVVEVFAMMAGIEIFVPDDWEVVGEVIPVMGGFEIKNPPAAAPKRQLIVRGTAIMAGVEVKRRIA